MSDARTLAAALDLLDRLDRLDGLSDSLDAVESAVDGLTQLVSSDLVGYNHFAPTGHSLRTVLSPRALILDPGPRLAPHVGTHPLIAHFVRFPHDQAQRMSDVCSLAVWTRTDAYRHVFAPYGLRYHVGIGRRTPGGGLHGFTLNRVSTDFSEEDRAVLSAVAPRLLDRLAHAASAELPLTVRQLAILRLLVEGCSTAEIASRVGISTRTVHKHLEHIYARLGVHGRSEALLLAVRSGLGPTGVYGTRETTTARNIRVSRVHAADAPRDSCTCNAATGSD